jgi:Right handed beta helix region
MVIIFLLFASYGSAAILHVGPGQQYATPCRAIAAAAAGDTIQIDASGTYRGDVCAWATPNLTILGVNGRPLIDAAGQSAWGKAIWVITGNNTTIENVELTGAAVEDHNGAAIRQEGANLTVRRCYIHGNEEGILAGNSPSSQILIENTEFGENGYNDGFAHNIYINHISRFTLRFSYSHDAISGHLVKSRAVENFIQYNRLTGESGTSSFELDLPNGGLSYVIGNVIEQGWLTENSTIVAYGEEGASNPNSKLYFVNNTVVNNRWNGTFIRTGNNPTPVLVQNNIFIGPGLQIDQASARLSHNLSGSAMFVDPGNHDYHLQSDSPARNFGVKPDTVDGYSLVPVYQYVHPACFETRSTTGAAIDAGAFEYRGGGGADSSCSGGKASVRLLDLILLHASVGGGETIQGKLRLSGPAPAGGATFVLSSSDPEVATVPATVVIGAGRTSGEFKISAANVPVSASTVISAAYEGATKTASLEVDPAAPEPSSLTLPSSAIAGGSTITATLTLTHPSPPDGTSVTLASFPIGLATVPGSITVPAGSTTARFEVKTANVGSTARVTIIAMRGTATQSVKLTVTPRGR